MENAIRDLLSGIENGSNVITGAISEEELKAGINQMYEEFMDSVLNSEDAEDITEAMGLGYAMMILPIFYQASKAGISMKEVGDIMTISLANVIGDTFQ